MRIPGQKHHATAIVSFIVKGCHLNVIIGTPTAYVPFESDVAMSLLRSYGIIRTLDDDVHTICL